MIQIKTAHEIELMRASGLVTAGALAAVKARSGPGVSTGRARRRRRGPHPLQGAVPELPRLPRVHRHDLRVDQQRDRARASRPDRRLAAGDNISIDCGAILQGWHSDSGRHGDVGEPSAEDAALLDVTERSMWAGLARAIAGGRLTDISAAVEQTITAESHPYGIVDHYGGHGIGTEMHQDPHVLNYGGPAAGPSWCRAWRWPSSRW
jgi:methionyl aminopeptidase